MVDGAVFGRYRLCRIIGEGGMGRVYEAFDTVTDRTVALKVLPEALAANSEFRERFRREAHAAARLSEPHIVPIHDYGEIDGRLFLDMRLIDGMDLGTVLAQHGPLPPARAVHVIEQVAAALDAAHAAGLVHRDVKPSNIVLGARDFAYLIDFGIARDDSATAMTSVGTTLGTFAYMAPERFTPGQPTDARADTYSLACVFYECLTGTRPFPGTVVAEQIAAHLTAEPPRPSQAREGVPAAFDEVIARGMAKPADQRFRSAGEFAAAARAALESMAGRPGPRGAETAIGAVGHGSEGGGSAPGMAAAPAHGASAPGTGSPPAPRQAAPAGWHPGGNAVGEAAPDGSMATTVRAKDPGIGGLAVACLVVVCGLAVTRLIAAAAGYGDLHSISFPDYWLPVLALATVLALAVRALVVRRRSAVVVLACALLVASFPMALGDWGGDVTATMLTALGAPSRALGLLVVFVTLAVLMGIGVAANAPRRPAGASEGEGRGFGGYASWGSRVGAALLDGLPAGGLMGLGMGMLRAAGPSPGDHSGGSSVGGIAVMVLCYAATFAYLVWNVGFRQGITGQTWGKKVIGISVIGAHTGRPLGIGMSISRQLAHIVDALPCYLGFLSPLWDAKAQTFADKLIGSVVVQGAAAGVKSPAAHPADTQSPVPNHRATEVDPNGAANAPIPHPTDDARTAVDPRMATTHIAQPVASVDERVTTSGEAAHLADRRADSGPDAKGMDPRLAVTQLAQTPTAAPQSGSPSDRGRTELLVGGAVLAVVAVVGVAVAVTQAESKSDAASRLPDIVATIAVPGGAHEIAVEPGNRRAYVTGRTGGPVSVIDTKTNTVVGTIPAVPEPGGVAVDPARGMLYLTDRENRTVTLIDTGTREAVATIPVGYDPQSVIVDPDSPTIYVIGGSEVSVVDTAARAVTATIPVDSGTRKAALDPAADTLYVIADKDLTMIDTSTDTVTGSLAIPAYDYPNPLDVAVDPATHTVYVTAYGEDSSDSRTLTIIDPRTRTVLATVPAEGNALDVALDSDERTVYIANYNDVAMVDTQTRARAGTIEIPSASDAVDIEVDTDTHIAYVSTGGSVLVISR